MAQVSRMLKEHLARIDGAVAQPFIGTTVGLYCETLGRAGNHAFSRAKTPTAAEVRAVGASPLPNPLTAKRIADLVRILASFEALRDGGPADVPEWMRSSLVLKPNTVRLSLEPGDASGVIAKAEAEAKQAVEQALGLPVQNLGVTLYRNRVTADLASISADWHFDRRPTDWMRCFIYLSDVDEDCGPFHYFDRAESVRFCRRGFRRHSAAWQAKVEAHGGFHRLTGPKGSALIANAERVLHRAGIPAEGRHRDMFEFIFRPQA